MFALWNENFNETAMKVLPFDLTMNACNRKKITVRFCAIGCTFWHRIDD